MKWFFYCWTGAAVLLAVSCLVDPPAGFDGRGLAVLLIAVLLVISTRRAVKA